MVFISDGFFEGENASLMNQVLVAKVFDVNLGKLPINVSRICRINDSTHGILSTHHFVLKTF